MEEKIKEYKEITKTMTSLDLEIQKLEDLISTIEKQDYVPFYPLFWHTLKGENNFKSLKKWINDLKGKTSLTPQENNFFIQNIKRVGQFSSIFYNNNIEDLKTIQANILVPIEGVKYQFQVFDLLISFNKQISNILFSHLSSFETFLKTAIISIMIMDEKKFNDVSNYQINSIEKWNEIKHLNPSDDYKKNWKIFNVMMFGEIIEFIEQAKDEDFWDKIINNLLGKFKKNSWNEEDTFAIIKKITLNLKKIKELRNEVMHFKLILPTNDENILMQGVKSLITISKSENGEADSYLEMHAQILSITSSFLVTVNDKQILKYFQENILSFKVY